MWEEDEMILQVFPQTQVDGYWLIHYELSEKYPYPY